MAGRVREVLPAVPSGVGRGAVLLRFVDDVEVRRRESGWVRLEPGWVTFLSDEAEGCEEWVSFPSSSVVTVEWEPAGVVAA